MLQLSLPKNSSQKGLISPLILIIAAIILVSAVAYYFFMGGQNSSPLLQPTPEPSMITVPIQDN